ALHALPAAGHMTASDKCTNLIKNVLLCRSHPHMPFAGIGRVSAFGTSV
ncbi:MAG: hypothetical protein ACI9BH_001630, partial [Paracoccaceae bacterium]